MVPSTVQPLFNFFPEYTIFCKRINMMAWQFVVLIHRISLLFAWVFCKQHGMLGHWQDLLYETLGTKSSQILNEMDFTLANWHKGKMSVACVTRYIMSSCNGYSHSQFKKYRENMHPHVTREILRNKSLLSKLTMWFILYMLINFYKMLTHLKPTSHSISMFLERECYAYLREEKYALAERKGKKITAIILGGWGHIWDINMWYH